MNIKICFTSLIMFLGFNTVYAKANSCNYVNFGYQNLGIKFCDIPSGNSFQISQTVITQKQFLGLSEKAPWIRPLVLKFLLSLEQEKARGDSYNESLERLKKRLLELRRALENKKRGHDIYKYVDFQKLGQNLDIPEIGNDLPAVFVSAAEAQKFANLLSILDPNAEYRLPTSKELELAISGGTSTKYYWGDEFDPTQGYYYKNSNKRIHPVTSCPQRKMVQYCMNNYGLVQPVGNVFQWTSDFFLTNRKKSACNVKGVCRIIRGGSINTTIKGLESKSEDRMALKRSRTIGFRLVRIQK